MPGPDNFRRAWKGVDPSKQYKAPEARSIAEGYLGRQWTGADATAAQNFWGLSAPLTNEMSFSGDKLNALFEWGAGQTGGTWEAWKPPAPPPTTPPPPATTPPPPPPPPIVPMAEVGTANGPGPLKLPDPLTAPNPFVVKPFKAPTRQEAYDDEGYQFALGQGLDTLKAEAAARGDLFTGGTMKGLSDYATKSASSQYDKVFDREYGEWRDTYGMDADTDSRNWDKTTGVYDRNVDRSVLRDKAWRDDRAFDFGREVWEDDKDRWNKTYESGERRWGAEFTQRVNEFKSSDEFRRYVYGTDDEWRRYRATIDDAWKREVADEQRRQFLAELGTR